jgi:hypothetical protein
MHISDDQISLFKKLFAGRLDVYGTYDPQSGRVWQVKKPVTNQVICDHLEGRAPYGVYLLNQDRVSAVAADFDHDDENPPRSFVREAQKLDLPAYVERSKRKGYHVWMFFGGGGVLASKARLVVLHLLKRIQMPGTEVFPKQDRLRDAAQYGNFINAPLFGRIVPQGRAVFVGETFKPHADQWEFLKQIQQTNEAALDKVINAGHLSQSIPVAPNVIHDNARTPAYALPHCARQMLAKGVAANQRVACFRLACQLRKVGLPQDLAVETLLAWSRRNRPADGKPIIASQEVHSQTQGAYSARVYWSCGCEDPAVMPFCDSRCPIRRNHFLGTP